MLTLDKHRKPSRKSDRDRALAYCRSRSFWQGGQYACVCVCVEVRWRRGEEVYWASKLFFFRPAVGRPVQTSSKRHADILWYQFNTDKLTRQWIPATYGSILNDRLHKRTSLGSDFERLRIGAASRLLYRFIINSTGTGLIHCPKWYW